MITWGLHGHDTAQCPYCMALQTAVNEIFDDAEGCTETDCGECSKTFHVKRTVRFTYSTARKAHAHTDREAE